MYAITAAPVKIAPNSAVSAVIIAPNAATLTYAKIAALAETAPTCAKTVPVDIAPNAAKSAETADHAKNAPV